MSAATQPPYLRYTKPHPQSTTSPSGPSAVLHWKPSALGDGNAVWHSLLQSPVLGTQEHSNKPPVA